MSTPKPSNELLFAITFTYAGTDGTLRQNRCVVSATTATEAKAVAESKLDAAHRPYRITKVVPW